ncbi:MAG: hypothetical protein QXN36_06510 [Candidatus Bathyarchaeia archaeon]
MPARKIRVEVFDSEGNKYAVAFEGQITREKALRLLDMVELLGGMPTEPTNPSSNPAGVGNGFTKYEKVRTLIHKHFPIVWFSSKDVQTVYEQEFKEPICLSTVATYLTRLTTKGILTKTGAANSLKYKLTFNVPQATLKQQIPKP